MAQKINPTSIKIGQQSSWITTYQVYGKSLVHFSYFHNSYFLLTFLLTNFSYYFVLSNFYVLNNNIYFFIKHEQQRLFNKNFLIVLNYISFWFLNNYEFKKRLFPLNNNLNFASAISFYFKFLVHRKIIFRKIMLIVVKLLSMQLESTKLVYSKFGIKKIQLKGFKLRLVGRFENTKNQMSKKIEYAEGSLSLISVNSHVEFFTVNIYSKLGVCNFKIWLFFKQNNETK